MPTITLNSRTATRPNTNNYAVATAQHGQRFAKTNQTRHLCWAVRHPFIKATFVNVIATLARARKEFVMRHANRLILVHSL